MQHEIHQQNEYDLIVDAIKTTLDNSLIGWWISISWHRQTETLDFFAFDVGVVTDVEEGKVFVDYKDEGVHAVPLNSLSAKSVLAGEKLVAMYSIST